MKVMDWDNIHCVACGEKRKPTSKNNKVWYDPKLSEKSKGKMVFFCTNHDPRIYFVVEIFAVNDDISSMRIYCVHDKKPNHV